MLIPFEKLFPKYEISTKGILHVGAHTGQEAERYYNLGVKNMCFVEAIPSIYQQLVANVSKYGAVCVNACVSDKDGEKVEFKVTNNEGQSSSILNLGTHKKEHPSVVVVETIPMVTTRLDTFFSNTKLVPRDNWDFLVMDLQGAELMALRGMGDLLHGFNYIYLEVNDEHLYEGCALVNEIDEYLAVFGFERVETKWTDHHWGDALFLKKSEKN